VTKFCAPKLVRGFPSNENIKDEHPIKDVYFAAIGSSNVKTVADRHRHTALVTSILMMSTLMTLRL